MLCVLCAPFDEKLLLVRCTPISAFLDDSVKFFGEVLSSGLEAVEVSDSFNNHIFGDVFIKIPHIIIVVIIALYRLC